MMKTTKRTMRITLIAAALAVVLCISAAAVAVISAWQMEARQALGLNAQSPIAEYTEYDDTNAPNAQNENGSVKLLSTVCSGSRMDAFLVVSDVPADAAQGKECWQVGQFDTHQNASTVVVSQLGYDADSNSSLVRVTLLCDALKNELEQIPVSLSFDTDESSTRYPAVNVPVTESRILTGQGSVELDCGTVTRANVAAGYVELELVAPAITAEDAEAIHKLTQAERKRINEALADATVQFADGSSVKIADLESTFASGWVLTDGDLSAMEAGSFAVQHVCQTVLDTEQIVSVTVGGIVIPVA